MEYGVRTRIKVLTERVLGRIPDRIEGEQQEESHNRVQTETIQSCVFIFDSRFSYNPLPFIRYIHSYPAYSATRPRYTATAGPLRR